MLLHHFAAPFTTVWPAPLFTLPGGIGVTIFFVLSGFLVTGILLRAQEDPCRWRNFFARRGIRIFPLYFLSLSTLLLLAPVLGWPTVGTGWFWSYAYNWTPLLGVQSRIPWAAHFWSLCVQEQFYLLWPLVVWRMDRTALLRFCIAGIALSWLLRLAAVLAWGVIGGGLHATPFHLDALLLGSALAVLRSQGHALQVGRWVLWSAIGFFILAIWMYPPRTTGWFVVTVFAGRVLAGVLVLSAISAPREFLVHPRLIWLGKYSYGLYIWHLPLQGVLRHLFPQQSTSTVPGQLGEILILFAASCLVAWASWHLFERHFLALKRYFEPGRAPAPAQMMPAAQVRPSDHRRYIRWDPGEMIKADTAPGSRTIG